ncbi:MAG: FAD-binding oxidoreductase [Gemmatimonadota bacterium]
MTDHTTEIPLVTREGTILRVPREKVREWSEGLKGEALAPGDEGYEDARLVWNGMIDVHPSLIVRCEDADDVARTLGFAADHGARLSIRGGGHNVAGTALVEGGVVVDLSRMRRVEVDPEARVARVEGGATLGDIDRATDPHGLATPTGFVSQTGIGGLALRGGLGHRMRALGLACDNIEAVELVTSDGAVTRVTDGSDPDLMWAIRGGPLDMGVVTRFEFRLHPVPDEVRLILSAYPAELGVSVNRLMEELLEGAPPELGLISFYVTLPYEEELPSAVRGREVIALFGMYTGPKEDAEDLLAPIHAHPELLADLGGWMPYPDAQSAMDEEYPDGMRYYWKSLYLDELTEDLLKTMHRLGRDRVSPHSTLDLWTLGGAVDDVDPERSSFPARGARYMVAIEANWEHAQDDDANLAWARRAADELEPYATRGFYLNFAGGRDEQEKAARRLYEEHMERLESVQRRVDPAGLFTPRSRDG